MDLALFFVQLLDRAVDPIVIAAGVIPPLATKYWRRSLPAAALAGSFIGFVSALGLVSASVEVAAVRFLATVAGALVWWAIAFWGRRYADPKAR